MSGRLTMLVCGAPLAARAAEVAERLTLAGWTVASVRSAAAAQWCPGPAESGAPSLPAPAESAADGPRPDQVVASR